MTAARARIIVAAVLAWLPGIVALAGGDVTIVRGGTVHPIAAAAIADGAVVFEGGVITAVGPASSMPAPAEATVIDATGLDVWPGMVDAQSYLGLADIWSVRGTLDRTESGQMNPNARAEVAINVSSLHIPVSRANGVLLAATAPGGSLVPGTAATIALDGWTWEEMVRHAPAGLVIEWPGMAPKARPREGEEKKKDEGPTWQDRVASLDEMVREARAYAEAIAQHGARDRDVRWEALIPVVRGEVPVWIVASDRAQILAALDWTEKQGLPMVLIDGGDGWLCAAELAARHVPVVTETTRQPRHRYDPYDTPFAAPGVLAQEGVAVAFGSFSSADARRLPQEAARAMAYGLPRELAERGVTLTAAEVCGIADRYGSLEVGKSATLLLVHGDLLDTRMEVRRAFLDGRELSLESHHTELWKKWDARPEPAGHP